ncbi:MAG: dihydroorotase [Acidobacteria bacterium]|nr:MAG: dihydroorotase [Acidobacteriota bacterium]
MKSTIVISSLLSISALFSSTLLHSEPTPPPQYDILIKNGRVVDGTGRAGFVADVAIKGDRIARIGKLGNARARRVIDAKGLVVAPGFIDLLGQSETNLLIDPRAMSKVMMGVTTEITGEGNSAAPTNPPTTDELIQMRRLVAEAMEDGALGLSTSLQYVPARFAKTNEIVELAMVAERYGGIYATHQRSEANALDSSLAEVFEIGRRAHIPVEIWHLKTAYKKNWGRMPEILKRIEAARASGLKINANVYPYTAASTALTACLPPWALEGGNERMLERLRDSKTRERLKREIMTDSKDWENIFLGSGGGSGVLISSVVYPELENLQGKRISEIAADEKKDDLDALFDLILADKGETSAIYFMMSEDDLRAALRSPFVAICTDSGARAIDGPLSTAKGHPRGWGSYPRILSRYVRDEHLLTIEEAVHKMTGLSAERVGLKDRGTLRQGAYADITIFDPQTVRDRSTFENPNQYPECIPYVIINGQISVDGGQRTKALSGRVLRGPGYKKQG